MIPEPQALRFANDPYGGGEAWRRKACELWWKRLFLQYYAYYPMTSDDREARWHAAHMQRFTR